MTVPLVESLSCDRKYLIAAVGEEQAEQAMLLPEELRQELYGEILSCGPAVSEVTHLEELARAHVRNKDEAAKQFLSLAEAINVEALVRPLDAAGGEENSLDWLINQWSDGMGYDSMDGMRYRELYNQLFSRAQVCVTDDFYALEVGLRISFWFLTGQHIFSYALADKCMRCVPQVNELLVFSGMQPLSGKLML